MLTVDLDPQVLPDRQVQRGLKGPWDLLELHQSYFTRMTTRVGKP